jgi:DNA-binding response OmpR family regulator
VESGLKCLLLSTDDKAVRVLRRVLSEMDVEVEHCSQSDEAVQKITRQRFEAVIVDCATPRIASSVLKATRSSPANKRAVSVAVLDDQPTSESQNALKHAFEMGAHFVLFKPISLEKTRASFRAVRALMKRERRRHARIPINLPVEISEEGKQGGMRLHTVDVGENGVALRIENRKLPASFQLKFALPGKGQEVVVRGEVAWEGNQVAGIRFSGVDIETADRIKRWIESHLAGAESDEIPVSCKLTDLSLNACYLQTESPFPVQTRLQLLMKVGELQLQVEGLVRIMHPGAGMGVEFTQHTPTQRAKVEEFIHALVNTAGALPDLQVKPDAIDNSAATLSSWQNPEPSDPPDPLLTLFHEHADTPADAFIAKLQKQRGGSANAAGA